MHPSTNEIITWALSSENTGHLKKVREKCFVILENEPGNVVILHIMGIVEFQLGNFNSALQWIEKALEIMPGSAELHGKYGNILAAQKKYPDAIIAFKRALAIKPDYAKAYYGLGVVFKACGDDENAITAFNNALSIDPDYTEVLNDLGILLKNNGALDEAAHCFTRALAVKPDYPIALNNLGLTKSSLGKTKEAEELYRRAIALQPDYPDALNNLGIILYNQGSIEESVALYKKAIALQPGHADAMNNLGITILHRGLFAESIVLFRKALAAQPDHSEALNNLGGAMKNAGNLTEAIATYEQALRLKDEDPDYHTNRSMALLAAGRFDEGWREYEWRWKTSRFADVTRLNGAKPLWQGEKAHGRTLLIRAEQGFGDTLQFCRYAPLAAARGMRVVLEVQPALVKLMGSLPGVERTIAQGQSLPDFDLYCPMMSLPAVFNTRLETIPADVPYLWASAESVDVWRNRLENGNSNMLKVGLVWAGSSRSESPDLIAADRRRSIPADILAPLMTVSGIRFFNVQKAGPPAPKGFGLTDHMDECRDFADTAALITNLDLIISVDTAVAHLAGALGKSTWVLSRFDSCWRWLQAREDSPWYPSMRLFRQQSPGDWEGVIVNVRNELQKMLTDGS
jgi:Tfp pilus assembly protein PilF